MPEDLSSMNIPASETPPLLLDDAFRQALADSVVSDYRRWKQSRARLESKWRECWEAYLCDVKSMYTEPEPDQTDRSRVVRPVLYEAVETIHSHLLNSLFPANERFFTVVGKTEADHRHAHLIEEFLRIKLEEAGFLEKFSLFLKQAIITGNTAAAVPWKTLRQARRVEKPVQLFGVTVGYQKTEINELVYNGPDFEVLDIFDFLVDPDATDVAQAKIIRKVERSLLELQSAGVYTNLDQVQATVALDSDDANKLSKKRAFGLEQSQPTDLDPKNGKVKLLEAWGDFVVNGTVYANHVCVVANGKTVIRFEPNPYDSGLKPFVFTSFIPVPNEVYGIGAIEKSLGLQHAINTLTNQKIDVINLSINSPFTYLINDDIFDPETMVTRPGALIPVKSHETLRPIQYLNNFTVAFEEIADLKSEVQEATGALKFFTGGESDTPRTATEVAALVSGGRQKFSSFLSHLEHTSLAPFLKRVLEYARQFITQPELLRVCPQGCSPQYQELMPELLKTSECCFRIDGSSGQIFKEQELKSLTAFLQIAENSTALHGQVDLPALYRKIYRRLGFTDETEIFRPMQTYAEREVEVESTETA
jgi:hypothetical protein